MKAIVTSDATALGSLLHICMMTVMFLAGPAEIKLQLSVHPWAYCWTQDLLMKRTLIWRSS